MNGTYYYISYYIEWIKIIAIKSQKPYAAIKSQKPYASR